LSSELIPLKARAWLDLSARKAAGEAVDSKDIRKHANDIIRLAQLLAPDMQISLAEPIASDFDRFVAGLIADGTYDSRQLQIDLPLAEVADRLRRAYQGQRP